MWSNLWHSWAAWGRLCRFLSSRVLYHFCITLNQYIPSSCLVAWWCAPVYVDGTKWLVAPEFSAPYIEVAGPIGHCKPSQCSTVIFDGVVGFLWGANIESEALWVWMKHLVETGLQWLDHSVWFFSREVQVCSVQNAKLVEVQSVVCSLLTL